MTHLDTGVSSRVSMHSRKRQASESILPFRAPKSPRISRSRYTSDNMSSVEEEGILSRWADLWQEAWSLSCETVSHVIGGNLSFYFSSNATFSTSCFTLGPGRHQTSLLDPSYPLADHDPSPTTLTLPQQPPSSTSFLQPMDPPRHPHSLARPVALRQSETVISDDTTATSPPSTATWLASSSVGIPQLDDLLALSQRPSSGPFGGRPYKDTRRHIYLPAVRFFLFEKL